MISEEQLKEAEKFVKRTLAGMVGHGTETTRKGRVFETLKELIELRKPKETMLVADGELVYDTWVCPYCGKDYEVDFDEYDFCPNCGQRVLVVDFLL